MQEIAELSDYDLRVHDFTTFSKEDAELQVGKLIEQLILEPVSVVVGPLFEVRLVRLREEEHVLIVVMEHIISDATSKGILLRDLLATYAQIVSGYTFSLPAISMQFSDYAIWQNRGQKGWIGKHGVYWKEHLSGCKRLRFPEDRVATSEAHSGWAAVAIRIDRSLKAELREWCRCRQTTLVMSVFTAYVGLVLRWCNASECVITYQSNGRVSPEVENTIGYFASPLYVRVWFREDDSFATLIKRVTEEYCQAYEHADFGYMAAQVPRPEFTRSTNFNWLPQLPGIDLSGFGTSAKAIAWYPIHFTHPVLKKLELDNEPCIQLYDAGDEIAANLYFPADRFSTNGMQRFGRNFLVFIEALLRKPEGRVKDILLV